MIESKFTLFNVLILFSLLGIFGCTDNEEMEPDNTMDPMEVQFDVFVGKGVNDISIGDLGSKAVQSIGANYTELVNPFGDGNALYYMLFSSVDIQFAMDISAENLDVETLPIERIKFFGSFKGMTEAGIGIGSTLDEVQTAYGDAEVDFFGSHSYDALGIFLNYDDNDVVEDFTIYSP